MSLTTAKLLERFPHYDSLLMLCCLLGSENIPFDLLRTLYGTEDAHNFLIEMKKESLITSDYKLNGKRVISLHRFTQDLCLTYLATVKGLHLPKKPELLVKVINALESYVEKLVKNNNVQELRLMQGHIEKLLERDVLSPEMKASLEVIYGMLLYEMGVTLGDGKNIRILQRALQECDLLNEPKRSIRKGQANLYLGLLSQVTSKPQQAEEYYKESVKYLRKAKDSHWLSFTLAAYGQLRIISERDYNETEQLYLEAVRIGEASNAPSTFLARIYFTAGNLYGKWQKYKQGEPLFKKGFEVMAHQPNSYIYSWGWGFYGIFLQDKGDHYKAVEAFKKCVDLFQKRYGDKTRTMGWVKTRLGMGLMQIGHYKEAKKVLKEAVELNKMNGGKSNYGIALMYLGEAYLREGEFNAARKIIHESFELKKKIWGERVLVIWDPTPLAKLYIHDGHFEEAVTLLNQYLSSWRKKHGPNHESVIKLSLELAYMYMTHNKLENAKNLLFPLIDIVEKKYDQNHLFRGYLYWRLGEYHLLNEDYQKAGEVLNTAAVIFKQLGHPNLKEVLKLQTQSIKRMQP